MEWLHLQSGTESITETCICVHSETGLNIICLAHYTRETKKISESYKLQLSYNNTADMKVQRGIVVTYRTLDNEGSERKWLKIKMCYEKQKKTKV